MRAGPSVRVASPGALPYGASGRLNHRPSLQPNQRTNVMAGDLIGVMVGGAIGLAGSFLPHLWERRRSKSAASAILLAYISGILHMERIRKHGDLYRRNLDDLRSGKTTHLFRVFGSEDADDPLQKALLGHVGFLPPVVARDLVVFCNMLGGLRIDLKAIALGQMDHLQIDEKIGILERDLKLWEDTRQL